MKLLISLYIFFSNNIQILVTNYVMSNLREIVFLIDFGLYVKQYSLHSKRSDGQIQMFFKKSFQV